LPESTRDFMSRTLHAALTEGVAAYNRGNVQQCAVAYARGTFVIPPHTLLAMCHVPRVMLVSNDM
jgi:hypothetical protein